MRSRGRTAVAALVLAAVLGGFGVGAAQADRMDDLQEQQRANEAQQEQLRSQLEGTNVDLQNVYLELNQIELDLPVAQAELVVAEEDLAGAQRQQRAVADRMLVAETEETRLQEEIAEASSSIQTTEASIGELARSSYRGGDQLSALTVVLGASSPEEFASRSSAVSSALRSQGQALQELEERAALQRNQESRLLAVRDRIAVLQTEADAAVVAADDARQRAANTKVRLERLQSDRTSKAQELETVRVRIQDDQAAAEAENASIEADIKALAAEQAAERERQREAQRQAEAEAAAQRERERQAQIERDRQQNQNNNSGGGNAAPAPPAPAPPPVTSPGGYGLIPPVDTPYYRTSRWGWRTNPILGGRQLHYGVDIRSACGNVQWASQSGTVFRTIPERSNGTSGNQVVIDHGVINGDSIVTKYNHLSRFAVSQGQRVDQRQTIGYTGMTGAVTGCHVHAEVWINGELTDPEKQPGWIAING